MIVIARRRTVNGCLRLAQSFNVPVLTQLISKAGVSRERVSPYAISLSVPKVRCGRPGKLAVQLTTPKSWLAYGIRNT